MIQFKQNDTAAETIFTLTEKVTITEPYFLFVFTHVLTKNEVKFTRFVSQDESDFPNRYNKFTLNAAVLFEDQPIGEWHYRIYEQASSSNTSEADTGNLLETGKLLLDRATAFEYSMHQTTTSYTAYNG